MGAPVSGTIRASAVLNADYGDGTSSAVDVRLLKSLRLLCAYTRGGIGGAFGLKIELSSDGSTWYQLAAVEAPSVTAGADTVVNVQRETRVIEPPDANEYDLSLFVQNLSAVYLRIQAAETGNVGAPGTLAVEYMGQ